MPKKNNGNAKKLPPSIRVETVYMNEAGRSWRDRFAILLGKGTRHCERLVGPGGGRTHG